MKYLFCLAILFATNLSAHAATVYRQQMGYSACMDFSKRWGMKRNLSFHLSSPTELEFYRRNLPPGQYPVGRATFQQTGQLFDQTGICTIQALDRA